jgi:hypothetical protein
MKNGFAVGRFVFIGVVLISLSGSRTRAATLDFETLPGGGPPTESMNISNQYQASYGMRFANSDGSFPIIVQAGSPGVGFTSAYGDDTPAPGENCGSFFLTISATGPHSDLIVGYSSLASSVGGVVLDIDNNEAWTIRALDSLNHVVDTLVLDTNTAHTGDALATPWSFSHATADIASVRFTYTGAQNLNTGVAFDNFTFDAVPEPDTLALAAVGLCVGAGFLRRKRRDV